MTNDNRKGREDLALYISGMPDTPANRARIRVAQQFRLQLNSPEGVFRFKCLLCEIDKDFTVEEAWTPSLVEKWQISHLQIAHPRVVLS